MHQTTWLFPFANQGHLLSNATMNLQDSGYHMLKSGWTLDNTQSVLIAICKFAHPHYRDRQARRRRMSFDRVRTEARRACREPEWKGRGGYCCNCECLHKACIKLACARTRLDALTCWTLLRPVWTLIRCTTVRLPLYVPAGRYCDRHGRFLRRILDILRPSACFLATRVDACASTKAN